MILHFGRHATTRRLGPFSPISRVVVGLALVLVALAGGLVEPTRAQGSGTFNNFQQIGCYYNASDKKLWLAAISLNPKYTKQDFYEDDAFSVRIKSGDQKFDFEGKDILVHPMAAFDYKGAEKYQFMKFSIVVDYSSSIPAHVRTDVLNFIDEFIGKMPLAIEGQLIRFATGVEKFPFTSKSGDIRLQLKQPIEYGMTALHDALMDSATSLVQQGSSTPVRLVILFTDGFDTSSQIYKDRTNFLASFTNLVKTERIAVAAIGVTAARDEALLKGITDRSKGITGFYLPINDFGQLRKALQQVEAMVKNIVIFRMPKVGPDRGRAEIAMGLKTKGGAFNTFQTFDCEY